ncbi:hypothetical protein G6514_002929 [Epicoccum nigrum]|nr:hypothetical protein G6514_002929 [Epicoccum nigrum]
MASLDLQTLTQSSRSTIHITQTSTIIATLQTLTPTTSPTPVLATDTPTTISPLPSNFATPEPTAHSAIPTIAVLTLFFVVLLAASLLCALLYFIVLRIRGKCTNCIPLEEELHKWKTGELMPITRGMVDARMRKLDEENAVEGTTGAMDAQAALYRQRMRMESLRTLEGRAGSVRASLGESETTIVVGEDDGDNEPVASSFRPESNLEHLRPLVKAIDRKLSDDGTATPLGLELPKTHSQYLKKIIEPREAEAARLRREGQDQVIARNIDIASDASKRKSVQERAKDRANELILERVGEEKEEKEKENENKGGNAQAFNACCSSRGAVPVQGAVKSGHAAGLCV